MKKSFYFFRHGQTPWNNQLRLQGSLDIALDEKGREQARGLSEQLLNKGIEIIYSSDLSRALETATIVSQKLNINMIKKIALRECHFGDVEGSHFDEVKEKYGEEVWESFRISNPKHNHAHFPNAESPAEVYKRVHNCINEIIREDFSCIGISTHGAVLRNFIHPLIDPSHWPLPIPNCGVFHLEYDNGRWDYRGLILSSK